jgi:hypothetical protein
MNLLSGINNALSTVAKDCVDSALPANLKFIGDGVATATDIATGNYGKLPQDVADFAQDASHAAASATNSRTSSGEGERTTTNHRTSAGERERATTNHRGSRCQGEPATQPSAPPNTQTLVSLLTNLVALLQGSGGAQAGSTAVGTPAAPTTTAGTASTTASTTPEAPAALPSTTPTTATTNTTPASPAPSTAATTPTAPTAAPSTASAAPAASTPTTSTTAASTAATAAPSTSTAAATTGTANAFFGQSDADLMNAVRNGQIPDAVKNDPAQMQRLQQRMNDISEMNQMISQMMAAMHDMNKAVIQNIRA